MKPLCRFLCPGCGAHLAAEAGSPVCCVNCQQSYQVPEQNEENQPLPPPDDSGFLVECERLAFNVSALLRVARRCPSASAVIEMIRTVPASLEEAAALDQSSLFRRVVIEASRFGRHDEDFRVSVMEYFTDQLFKMPPERQAMLKACVVGSLLGWVSG